MTGDSVAIQGASGEAIAAFIARWQNTPGGAERANYQLFLTGLCHALGLD